MKKIVLILISLSAILNAYGISERLSLNTGLQSKVFYKGDTVGENGVYITVKGKELPSFNNLIIGGKIITFTKNVVLKKETYNEETHEMITSDEMRVNKSVLFAKYKINDYLVSTTKIYQTQINNVELFKSKEKKGIEQWFNITKYARTYFTYDLENEIKSDFGMEIHKKTPLTILKKHSNIFKKAHMETTIGFKREFKEVDEVKTYIINSFKFKINRNLSLDFGIKFDDHNIKGKNTDYRITFNYKF